MSIPMARMLAVLLPGTPRFLLPLYAFQGNLYNTKRCIAWRPTLNLSKAQKQLFGNFNKNAYALRRLTAPIRQSEELITEW